MPLFFSKRYTSTEARQLLLENLDAGDDVDDSDYVNSSSDSEDSDDGGGDIDEYERRPRSTATDTETGLDDYGFHSEEVDLDLHGSVVVGEDEDPSLP